MYHIINISLVHDGSVLFCFLGRFESDKPLLGPMLVEQILQGNYIAVDSKDCAWGKPFLELPKTWTNSHIIELMNVTSINPIFIHHISRSGAHSNLHFFQMHSSNVLWFSLSQGSEVIPLASAVSNSLGWVTWRVECHRTNLWTSSILVVNQPSKTRSNFQSNRGHQRVPGI